MSDSNSPQAPIQAPIQAPEPTPPSAASGAVPSGSTVASTMGGFAAAILMYALGRYGITLPAGSEAMVAGLFAALAGYLPKSGRQNA